MMDELRSLRTSAVGRAGRDARPAVMLTGVGKRYDIV